MTAPSTIARDNAIEVMLLRYGDTSTAGRTVTFQLPDDGEHPFKGLKTGASNGQRLALSVALIDDDETQTDLSVTDEPQKPKGGRLCLQAVMLCKDKGFWAFLTETSGSDVLNEGDAAEAVKGWCHVSSRSELDHNAQSAALWNALHAEYLADGGLGT